MQGFVHHQLPSFTVLPIKLPSLQSHYTAVRKDMHFQYVHIWERKVFFTKKEKKAIFYSSLMRYVGTHIIKEPYIKENKEMHWQIHTDSGLKMYKCSVFAHYISIVRCFFFLPKLKFDLKQLSNVINNINNGGKKYSCSLHVWHFSLATNSLY